MSRPIGADQGGECAVGSSSPHIDTLLTLIVVDSLSGWLGNRKPFETISISIGEVCSYGLPSRLRVGCRGTQFAHGVWVIDT